MCWVVCLAELLFNGLTPTILIEDEVEAGELPVGAVVEGRVRVVALGRVRVVSIAFHDVKEPRLRTRLINTTV